MIVSIRVSPFLLFAYLSCCTAVNVSPMEGNSLSNNPLLTRETPESRCILGIYDSSCWRILNLSDWLSNWNSTTPPCVTETDTSARCRAAGEAWTTTFLRIAQNITGGPDCVLLDACLGDSPNSNQIRKDIDSLEAARYRYVCYNIYAINFFFSNWYTAMHNAALQASDLVVSIVEAVDPPKKKSNVLLTDILSSLSAGLAFLAIPEAAALGGAAAAIAPIFLKAIQQAPGVAKIIWPIGSVEREVIEIGELQNKLQTVVTALGPRISQALATVMGKGENDISAFLAFAERGDFSKPRDQFPDVVKDTSGLLIGFTTFLVSEALVLSGWHAVASFDTDPWGLTNGTAVCPFWTMMRQPTPKRCWKLPSFNYYDMNCYGYDEYGQCNNSYWWYSRETNVAYTLSKDTYQGYQKSASKDEKDPTSILRTVFENGWSTGQLLLENAGRCAIEAGIYERFLAGMRDPNDRYGYGINISLGSFAEFKASQLPSSLGELATWYAFSYDGLIIKLNPPNGTNYTISDNGITDFNCTSQLNLTIFTDWPSVWYLHKKLT